MIKAVLFDLDNTLYDDVPATNEAKKGVFKIVKNYYDIDFEKFLEVYELSKDEIHRELAGTASSHNKALYFQRFIEKMDKGIKPSVILEMYDAFWNSFLDNIRLDDGVIDVLKFIKKKGLKTGLITNLTTHIQLRKIKRLGIEEFIDVLVTSEEAGAEKPRAIMFLKASNRLNVLTKESLMIGDSVVSDVEGSNAVGMKSVLINRNKTNVDDLKGYEKPDYVINNILELKDIIKDLMK